MKTKFTLLGGAAVLAFASMGAGAQVEAKEVWGKGAPEFTDPDGNIKFKVRGRIQMDYVNLEQDMDNVNSLGGAVATNTLDKNFAQSRIRRARLGVEGQFNSQWKYKLEATFAGRNAGSNSNAINDENRSEVQFEDAYVEYVGNGYSIVVGQQDLGYTLERLTSSRFSTNMERNMADQAFGFNRTMGIGVLVGDDNWGGQLFFNGDSLNSPDLAAGEEEYSVRAHGYYTPVNTPEQLVYVGATYRYRDGQDSGKIRYRARPETNIGDRVADTSTAFADSDSLYSVEAAAKYGPFYAQGEYTIVQADAVTGSGASRLEFSPEFSSYFIQAGWFLTGESRTYKGGKFDRIVPNAPVNEGGIGSWELRARYDYLDLDDPQTGALAATTVDGGTASTWTVGVNWTPVKNVRFMGEYVNAEADDRTITGTSAVTTANPNGNFDVVQFRAQFDF